MPARGVAISGKQGSGKSTLAKAIAKALNRHGIDSHTINFAEPVKSLSKAVLVQLGLVDQAAAEDDWKYRFRGVPQTVGTHLCGYDEDIWANLATARIRGLPASTAILNDDLRFPRERDALRREGMFLVRLEVDRELRLRRLGELPSEKHVSETALDGWEGWDLTIYQQAGCAVATPEAYALQILKAAGFQVHDTPRQGVLG